MLWAGVVLPYGATIAMLLTVAFVGLNLARRRWKSAIAIILLSPIVVFPAQGVVDYARGVGRLRFSGLPKFEAYNIDHVYRCEWAGGGCRIDGNEWLTQGSYNYALRTMIAILGPMPGSYIGPYPNEDECRAALQNAEEVDLKELTRDRVVLASGAVRLDAGVGRRLVRESLWDLAVLDSQWAASCRAEGGPITGVMHRGCLLLRVPVFPPDEPGDAVPALIVVLDPGRGRPFAYYRYCTECRHMPCFPPVSWRR